MGRLGAQQACGERGLDILFESAVERMGLAGGGHLAAQQQRGAARLGEREGGGNPHPAGNPRDRIDDAGIGARDVCLDFHPHLGSDRGGEMVLVGEVVEEAALGHPRAGDHLVDRDGVDRAVDQQFQTCGDQGGAGALRAGGRGGLRGHERSILDRMVNFKQIDQIVRNESRAGRGSWRSSRSRT